MDVCTGSDQAVQPLKVHLIKKDMHSNITLLWEVAVAVRLAHAVRMLRKPPKSGSTAGT